MQADRDAAAACHLIAVAQKSKARYIGTSVDISGASHSLARFLVERCHVGVERIAHGGRDQIRLDGGGEYAAAERLCQHQHIARLCADIFENAVGANKARDAQTVFRLIILNGVAARDDAAGFDRLCVAALQNGADVFFRQAVRHAQKVHRNLRLAAHGVYVAQCICRGDLTEEVRVVHNGGEKVDRFDDSDLIGDAVNGSVVAAVIADQKRRIRHVRQICKNFRQGTRPQLGGSTRRLCHLRETQLVVHGAHLLQKAAFIVEKCEAFVNSGV